MDLNTDKNLAALLEEMKEFCNDIPKIKIYYIN